MKCPRCQHENSSGQKFCGECGAPATGVGLVRAYEDLTDEIKRLSGSLREALDQQTATSDILRVISRSPTSLESIAQAIADIAGRLCNCAFSAVFRFDGELIHWVAARGASGVQVEALRGVWPRPPDRETLVGRVVLARETLHIRDAASDPTHAASLPTARAALAIRSWLGVPILREDEPIGVIVLVRVEVLPFSAPEIALVQTFATQAVIAIENARLFTETKEALERQTATSEILQVISGSPTDVQPVFETILSRAVELCGARHGSLFRFDGELLHAAAHHDVPTATLEILRRDYPMPPSGGYMSGRAILARRIVTIEDVLADELYESTAPQASGLRSMVGVPLLRDGNPVGVIVIVRSDPGSFTDRQIELLKTFADQAVIAIENVRLFTELQASNRELTTALDTQTATSDILRVISRSPTDVQPVFEAIAASAARLCGTYDVIIRRLEGDNLRLVAHHGPIPASALLPLGRGLVSGRAVLERRTVQVVDVQAAADELPEAATRGRASGVRTNLGVPLLREGVPQGVIVLRRTETNPFTDQEIALLQTFADQAVIAIENVRLFKELEQRNSDLIESLARQMATSEVLRVISQSPTELQPVFDTIAENARRLLRGYGALVVRFDGQLLHAASVRSGSGSSEDRIRARFPRPLSQDNFSGAVIFDRDVKQIADIETDDRWVSLREHARRQGWRANLGVPMMHNGQPIGVISVVRREPGGYSPQEVELLKTFADQAVIAIENVRLFNETKEALDRQTATAEILRVISGSPTDLQPVMNAVAERAAQLCEATDAHVYQKEGNVLRVVASHGALPLARQEVPISRQTVIGRAVSDCRSIHVDDLALAVPDEFPEARRMKEMGYRSILATPLLREGEPIGAIIIRRTEVRPFSSGQVALLQTFADQAVIAIENVRLFKELEEKNSALTEALDRQTATAEVLRVISQSQTEVQPVFDAIVNNGMRLFRAWAASIVQVDGELLHTVAVQGGRPGLDQYLREQSPWSIHQPTPVARCIVQRTVIHVPNTELDRYADEAIREVRRRGGMRSILAAPMLRDGQPIGAIWISRAVAGPFSPAEIALIQTFADQAVIAIENARLLSELQASNREIAEKSRQIEVASQHKSEFLANMSHELRTPLNAIIGFSEVLTDRMFGDLNEKQDEYLKDIYASGTHLLSLINDILDLSKIEAGRMELELSEFDLPTALDNAVMLVRERAQRRSLTLNKEVDAGVGQIQGDERKIRQVVLNLLSNAIKFTPEGGRIEVAAIPKDGCVEVSVSDTGVGIAPEDQDKVFEEFRQVGTADKKAEGTGLGLTLCRKFIELHGGRIWVTSQVGVGATFTFTIPVHRGE